MNRYLPTLSWLSSYESQWFPADLIAGLTITSSSAIVAQLLGMMPS